MVCELLQHGRLFYSEHTKKWETIMLKKWIEKVQITVGKEATHTALSFANKLKSATIELSNSASNEVQGRVRSKQTLQVQPDTFLKECSYSIGD
jgi:hypothetical protein